MLVAVIRSTRCLAGWHYERADFTAREIVRAALNRVDARRPSWEEGQKYFTDDGGSESCRWCGGSLEDSSGAAHRHYFCSDICAVAAHRHRESRDYYWRTAQAAAAYYLVKKLSIPQRPCDQCGTEFQPAYVTTRFCSPPCVQRARDGYIPERTCGTCGHRFKPQTKAIRFCSSLCYGASIARADIPCRNCGRHFRPRTDRQKVCSRSCLKEHGRPPMPCGHCGTMFKPTAPRSRYCCVRCRTDAYVKARRAAA